MDYSIFPLQEKHGRKSDRTYLNASGVGIAKMSLGTLAVIVVVAPKGEAKRERDNRIV